MVSRSLDERISRTMDEVYRLEAAAVTPDQRDAARSVGAALKSVQSAFETRVAAQRDSLATASGQSSELGEAESDASARLRQARRSLETTLDRLTRACDPARKRPPGRPKRPAGKCAVIRRI
jgi:hypothetical protein